MAQEIHTEAITSSDPVAGPGHRRARTPRGRWLAVHTHFSLVP